MSIREEADRLLYDFRLLRILKRHGNAHVIGGYRMDMMTHNDLDIYVQHEYPSLDILFAISNDMNIALKPYRFDGSYNVERKIFLCGCETDITGQRWNIDVSLMKKADISKTEEYCDYIVRRVSADPSLGRAIREIKLELIKLRLYGIDKFPERHYHSKDIYDAVLNEGILSFENFITKYPKII